MVRLLFFGATAEITGEREIMVDERGSSRASDLFKLIRKNYPKLGSHRLLYSINHQYATGDEVVHDGDELSIFTAVSGG